MLTKRIFYDIIHICSIKKEAEPLRSHHKLLFFGLLVNIVKRADVLKLRGVLGGELYIFRFFYLVFWRCLSISSNTKDLSVNNEIRAVQVRVIDDAGNQVGVMKTRDAMNMALEKGLDLVEIAPTAQIPVCRIMDYGKYKFEKAKKEKEAKKKQKQVIVKTKEIELSWNIEAHDFNTRLNYAKKFIEEGNKVKVSLELNRGREMAHMELGYQMIDKFEKASADFSVVEKKPIREGRKISMFIGPKKVRPEDRPKDPDKPAANASAGAAEENEEVKV